MSIPKRTTPSISRRRVAAVFDEVTRTGRCDGASALSLMMAFGSRMPPLAIVCATAAISSGVASTWPWPMALTLRSTSLVMCFGGLLARRREGANHGNRHDREIKRVLRASVDSPGRTALAR